MRKPGTKLVLGAVILDAAVNSTQCASYSEIDPLSTAQRKKDFIALKTKEYMKAGNTKLMAKHMARLAWKEWRCKHAA